MRSILLSLLCLTACANNGAPKVTLQTTSYSVVVNQTLTFDVSASDPERDPLTMTITNLPSGATFLVTDGVGHFSWSPIISNGAPGGRNYELVLVVDDGHTQVEQRIAVTVFPEDSAPSLLTESGYVLDLKRDSAIAVDIEFRDNDSTSLKLTLVSGPQGGQFTQTDTKLGQFSWTPTLSQIQEKQIHTLVVQADDSENPPVRASILIFLLNRPGSTICQGSPPGVSHSPLSNQADPGPFPISVFASDSDSVIQDVRVYWATSPPENAPKLNEVALSSSDGQTFKGAIPAVSPGDTVYYYVCATDNDDTLSSVCDHRKCIPEGSYFIFTAGSP